LAGGSVISAHAPVQKPRKALTELRRKAGGELSLVVLFVSPAGDPDEIAREALAAFPDTPVIGCTTAGEISSEGYTEGEIVALGLRSSHFAVRTALVSGLHDLDATRLAERVVRLRAGLEAERPDWRWTFAFLLIDGLSRREDQVLAALRLGIGAMPLFGGSAGDGLDFRRTLVLADGRFREDAAVLALVRSRCPVRVFKLDHMTPTEVKMVVTEADPERRRVREINAEPAAREYARLVGKDPDQLTPFIFASHPVVVTVGGQHYVRAIYKVEEDGDLIFFSAIDEGLVLTLAEADATGIAAHLDGALSELARERAPETIIGCDCILRRLEVEHVQSQRETSRILSRHKVIGFSTYGEQFNSVHVNQTFTGVAIYPAEAPEEQEP
jgi:hypothetical protein